MKLVRVYRRSNTIDDLVRKNFGTEESLWNPKCFDRLYKLVDGRKLLGVCTLQWSPDGYWILGDICVYEHGKRYGSEIVKRICEQISEPIWADATHPASERILEQNSFKLTSIKPWPPHGKPYILGIRARYFSKNCDSSIPPLR